MKKLLLIVLIIISGIIISSCCNIQKEKVEMELKLIDGSWTTQSFEMYNIDESQFRIGQYKGTYILYYGNSSSSQEELRAGVIDFKIVKITKKVEVKKK